MNYLADSNVLLRWVQPGTPDGAQAVAAVEALWRRDDEVYITPQNVYEFWSVATRSSQLNGLGMPLDRVEAEVARIEDLFPILPDTLAVYREWRRLVASFGTIGAHVHDARLVAVMAVHGISCLLTCDVDHFRRYAGISVVHPAQVVASEP